MMRLLSRAIVLAICSFILTGCASIFDGGNAQVRLSGTTGAKVVIKDEANNEVSSGQLPFTANLERKARLGQGKIYTFEFSKADFETQTKVLKPEINNWFWGNILIGGLIGIIVDANTGAMWTYEPDPLVVQLRPLPAQKSVTTTDTAQNWEADKTLNPRPVATKKDSLFLMPLPTGYARIEDASQAPIRAELKENYQQFISSNINSKATVIGIKGGLFTANKLDLASLHGTFERCLQTNNECWLYSFGNEVVWSDDKTQRISLAQLRQLTPDQLRDVDETQHPFAIPPASKFAGIEEINKVPVRGDRLESYTKYVKNDGPKAFVIGEHEGAFSEYGANAIQNAFERCAKSNRYCWLYAVDNRVLWAEMPYNRISLSDLKKNSSSIN